MTASTWSSPIVRLAPGRGSSNSPSRRRQPSRRRHLPTAASLTRGWPVTSAARRARRTCRDDRGPHDDGLGAPVPAGELLEGLKGVTASSTVKGTRPLRRACGGARDGSGTCDDVQVGHYACCVKVVAHPGESASSARRRMRRARSPTSEVGPVNPHVAPPEGGGCSDRDTSADRSRSIQYQATSRSRSPGRAPNRGVDSVVEGKALTYCTEQGVPPGVTCRWGSSTRRPRC